MVGSKEIFPKDKKGHIINIKSHNLGLLPTLYYLCNAMRSDDYNIKQCILDCAQNH